MAATMANFFISLVDYSCILLVIGYCIIRTPSFYLILKYKDKLQKQAILALFFGALYRYFDPRFGVSNIGMVTYSAMLATVLAGLAAGMIYKFRGGNLSGFSWRPSLPRHMRCFTLGRRFFWDIRFPLFYRQL